MNYSFNSHDKMVHPNKCMQATLVFFHIIHNYLRKVPLIRGKCVQGHIPPVRH